jgi:hypothetical protein
MAKRMKKKEDIETETKRERERKNGQYEIKRQILKVEKERKKDIRR